MSFLIIIAAIAVLLFLTIKKVSPFIALLLVTLMVGFLYGLPFPKLMKAVQDGVGSTLGSMALILCLGAMQGRILEKSGAATVISQSLMKTFGKDHLQWAVLLMGFLVGIPLFYNAGFVILVPFVFTIAASAGVPLLYVAMPMAASLSVTHGFLPPHPGPVALAAIFKASIGKTILYGMMVALPLVWIAGVLFGKRFRHRGPMVTEEITATTDTAGLPTARASIWIALLSVLLIAIPAALINIIPADNPVYPFLMAIGEPVLAMLIAALLAGYWLGIRKGMNMATLMGHYGSAIESIAIIMMVIAAGGAFKQVLTESGVANEVASLVARYEFPPLVAGWLVAAAIRVMIGSATVSALTAAGIVAPIVQAGGVSPEWMVLSVGAGSLFFSHVNDTGFWMFKEYFRLTVKETLLSWTIMETIVSIGGLLLVLLYAALM